MIRWNDKYGIKFMRLSSEMFPFASHQVYGYKLAPFAADALAEAGRVIAELGHRVSVHPGQFSQLGSPRNEVIESSVRDLEYHDELLSLLKLPEQQDRDAVMILHMGGTYGSKPETLDRFRHNYTTLLSDSIKRRLVLENDDMSWSVHDLLPICQELNIPMVLDFHHHNIIFDSTKVREGTMDIMDLFPVIRETWKRKGINQKMHYSEPVDGAVSNMARRKHSARVRTLPPCVPDMDLMIEAKDKEQAVFELMKKFKLPGHEKIGDLIAHERGDENDMKPISKAKKEAQDDAQEVVIKPEEEVGMGGPENRVYWPLGHEDWLRPKKRERKPVVEDDQVLEVADETQTPKKKSAKRPVMVKEVIKKSASSTGKPPPKKRTVVLTPSDTASDGESDEPAPKLPRRKSDRRGRVSYKEDSSN
jgi:UV DNA damage endonuclease